MAMQQDNEVEQAEQDYTIYSDRDRSSMIQKEEEKQSKQGRRTLFDVMQDDRFKRRTTKKSDGTVEEIVTRRRGFRQSLECLAFLHS